MMGRGILLRLATRRSEDRGAVAVVVAVLMVVFVGLGAFTVDYGHAYAKRRAMSSTADGAALSAAREFQRLRTSGQTCSQMVSANGTAATEAANLVKTTNGPNEASLATTYDCTDGYLTVTATMTTTTNAFLGGVYGKNDYDLSRKGRAVVAPAGSVAGSFRPFGLCEVDARSVIAGLTTGADSQSSAVKVKLAKTAGTTCGIDGETVFGSGNESRVNLDPTFADYLEAMKYTGTTRLTIDSSGNVDCQFTEAPTGWCSSFTGEGGTNSQVTAAINALLDTIFMFPVYDQTTGTGSGTRYHISGFISAKLCGWQLKNIEESSGKPKVNDGACYDSSPSNKFDQADGDALQLRAARYVPPSELARCPPVGNPEATGTPCSLTTGGGVNEFVPVVSKLFG